MPSKRIPIIRETADLIDRIHKICRDIEAGRYIVASDVGDDLEDALDCWRAGIDAALDDAEPD